MEHQCFIHLKGINEDIEKELHSLNFKTWNCLIENIDEISKKYIYFSTHTKKTYLLEQIRESQSAYVDRNWQYFTSKLLSKNHFKLLSLTQKIAYVDIETTGLSKDYHYITTIGIYDGVKSKIFVKDIDLDDAISYLNEFDVIVTFNGKTFDIPFIENHFKQKIDKIHLDLRYMLKEFDLSGGLKRIERELGLVRSDELMHIDGFEAVRLWKRYQSGDLEALELLKKYNIEDIENLEILLDWYLNKKNK